MARFSGTLVTCLALYVLGRVVASDLCSFAATQSAQCAEKLHELDATSLLSVSAKLHNVGKAGKATNLKDNGGAALDTLKQSKLFPGAGKAVAGALTNEVAKKIVSAVNGSLADVDKEVNGLLKECKDYEATTLKHISAAHDSAKARAQVLEDQVKASVGKFSHQWSKFIDLIKTAVSSVSSTLKEVGEKHIAKDVDGLVDDIMPEADAVRKKLADAADSVANMHDEAESKIAHHLAKLNDILEDGVHEAHSFAKSLDHAFGKMLDTAAKAIADKVPGANKKDLKSTFAALKPTVTSIQKHVVKSMETLAAGVRKGAALVTSNSQKSDGECAKAFLSFCIAVGSGLLSL